MHTFKFCASSSRDRDSDEAFVFRLRRMPSRFWRCCLTVWRCCSRLCLAQERTLASSRRSLTDESYERFEQWTTISVDIISNTEHMKAIVNSYVLFLFALLFFYSVLMGINKATSINMHNYCNMHWIYHLCLPLSLLSLSLSSSTYLFSFATFLLLCANRLLINRETLPHILYG